MNNILKLLFALQNNICRTFSKKTTRSLISKQLFDGIIFNSISIPFGRKIPFLKIRNYNLKTQGCPLALHEQPHIFITLFIVFLVGGFPSKMVLFFWATNKKGSITCRTYRIPPRGSPTSLTNSFFPTSKNSHIQIPGDCFYIRTSSGGI